MLYRYFNTRLELFDAVLNQLTTQYLDGLQEITSLGDSDPDIGRLSAEQMAPLFTTVSKIFVVGNLLASENYQSDRVRDNFTKIVDKWTTKFELSGISSRLARTMALQHFGLALSRPNASHLIDFSDQEARDIFQLMIIEVQSHVEISKKLGWDDPKVKSKKTKK